MRSGAIFDLPGPRGKLIIRVVTTISLAGIAVLLYFAYLQFRDSGQLNPDRWEYFTRDTTVVFLANGFKRTAIAASWSALIALPLGLLLAIGRLSRRTWLRWPATGVIEFFRGIPLLLIVYVFLFVLPGYGFNPDKLWKLVIPIALCAAATIAEVFRAGILALPAGQSEAGAAVGMTDSQVFWSIVLPQAVRIVIPSLVSNVVILLKDTTLGYVVSYSELMQSARQLSAYTHLLIQPYLIIAVFYVVLNCLISYGARALDARMAAGLFGKDAKAKARALDIG
ncbi:MAG: amino acid ABC transporter permease [Propionibacteriaceae bacterium]|jgi:glutamate transport system permease protein|nr:amino acid ABC transporter permease [Propionibacteriaceae bacterium]